MTTKITVARTLTEAREMRLPVTRQPMTTLDRVRREPVFVAPVSRPGAETRLQRTAARSANGLWSYAKVEGGLWEVTYLPTGQSREEFGSLDYARQVTASDRGLLLTLRREAYTAALVEGTEDGQRWLAVHMRMSQEVSAELRCQCGGLIVQVTSDGQLGHVDACDECLPYGGTVDAGTVCPTPERHRFCATPSTIECAHHGDDRRYAQCELPALPNRGAGCERGGAEDCCGECCASE